MKISFVATFMTHHQLPFSLKMVELTNNNYTYIAFNKLDMRVVSDGYRDLDYFPFVIRAYESDEARRTALKKIMEDDMVIFGSCPDQWVELRNKTGKPFIIYSERFFKKGLYRRFIPITRYKIKKRMLQFEDSNVSIICSSAYLPYDISLLHAKFKMYKWGYFPECKSYSIENLMKKKNNLKPVILWVGRMIKLKNPQHAILAANELNNLGYDFELNFVGDGPLRYKLERMVNRLNLSEKVNFFGSKKTEEVRKYMESANIFLFTSDRNEGWGAVLNEAMNSGCAVIGSHIAGSVPFLIKDGKNGLIYESGNIKHLVSCLKTVINNSKKCNDLGIQAYKSISEQWNPNDATIRLYNTIEAILNGHSNFHYQDGPCSIAEIISDKYKK